MVILNYICTVHYLESHVFADDVKAWFVNFFVVYADLRLVKKALTVVLVLHILIYLQHVWLIFYSWCMNFFFYWNLSALCTLVWGKAVLLHVLFISIYFSWLKVKLSYYRPGEALRAPGTPGFRISGYSAHESGKVVSPTHRPPLPSRRYSS